MRKNIKIIFFLLAVATLCFGCRRIQKTQKLSQEKKEPSPVKIIYPGAPGSFVKLINRIKPSVVHIRTSVPVRGGPADWFLAFYTQDQIAMADSTAPFHQALGSGVIIDKSGHVLTNDHVVGENKDLWIKLENETEFKAQIVGKDPRTDICLLKAIIPSNVILQPARIGDSDQLQVGEWVIALGNPFGIGITASTGIISAREQRNIPLGELGFWRFIQTDAQINPQNSGGPLINTVGEVIAINTALKQEANPIGFAMPINTVKTILPVLKSEGRVVRSWVGIYIDEVTKAHAKSVGLKETRGALVTQVLPKGPAERSGIKKGDIILSFDFKSIKDATDLPSLAALAGVNRLIVVEVWRGNKQYQFSLKTEKMPE